MEAVVFVTVRKKGERKTEDSDWKCCTQAGIMERNDTEKQNDAKMMQKRYNNDAWGI